jgi:hypothetical protein
MRSVNKQLPPPPPPPLPLLRTLTPGGRIGVINLSESRLYLIDDPAVGCRRRCCGARRTKKRSTVCIWPTMWAMT